VGRFELEPRADRANMTIMRAIETIDTLPENLALARGPDSRGLGGSAGERVAGAAS
jgi:hypothetical protein